MRPFPYFVVEKKEAQNAECKEVTLSCIESFGKKTLKFNVTLLNYLQNLTNIQHSL